MKNFKKILPLLILFLGTALGFTVLAQTDTVSPPPPTSAPDGSVVKNITFPIIELGNCGSKEECRNFCNQPENITACVAFAKSHGLMNQDEATRAEKFGQKIKGGQGPGGCTDAESCKNFCSTVANLDVCTAWAEKNGIKDDHFTEAKKINGYLKSGGQMPGGCTSKETCESYCGDFSHAEECFAFAKKVGLNNPGGPNGEAPNQKILELMKSGQTPGGCQSKDACEAYCHDQNHFEECANFAEKAGLVKPEEAALIKATGGKGPGGCVGEACRTYCNDQTHRDECFKFAEDHGLIASQELQKAKEGMTRMRAGLENAPAEVQACLKTELGDSVLSDIQSGQFTPGLEIGDKVRSCFEKFGGKHDPTEVLKNAPPEVLSCLKDKGFDPDKIKNGKTEFTPETGDTFRVCFQGAEFNQKGFSENGPGQSGSPGPSEGQPNFTNFLKNAPSGLTDCFQNALGDDFEKLKSGELKPTPDLEPKLKTCFTQFRPPMMGQGASSPGASNTMPPMMPPDSLMHSNLPPAAESCLKSALGNTDFERLKNGELKTSEVKDKISGCFNNFGGEGKNPTGPAMPMMPGGAGPGPRTGAFPEAVAACLKGKLSEDQVAKLMSGNQPDASVQEVVKACFSNFTPPPSDFNRGGSSSDSFPNSNFGDRPPTGNFIPPQGGSQNGFHPPEGSMPPPGGFPGGFTPPPGFIPPTNGQFPGGSTPPGGTPPPSGSLYHPSLLSVILSPFVNLFFR